jgi:hypothetical protein
VSEPGSFDGAEEDSAVGGESAGVGVADVVRAAGEEREALPAPLTG